MEEKDVKFGEAPAKKSSLRNDVILVLVILAFALAVCAVFIFGGEAGDYATVLLDGKEIGRYSLSRERTVELITGEDGEYYNLLVIKGGVAYVEEANCPDAICKAHRPISKSGDTIVCLPHKLVIRIDAKSNAVDI
jgi:hypothetical protein